MEIPVRLFKKLIYAIFCIVLVVSGLVLYFNDFKKLNTNHFRNVFVPKNVFFDLGANNGDSVDNFLGTSGKANGGNIRSKIPADKLNQKWIIHAIEGNSFFDSNLLNLKTKYKNTGHQITVHNGTIVTSYDGFITFYIDKNNQYGNHVGSSILENHPDVILSKKIERKQAMR